MNIHKPREDVQLSTKPPLSLDPTSDWNSLLKASFAYFCSLATISEHCLNCAWCSLSLRLSSSMLDMGTKDRLRRSRADDASAFTGDAEGGVATPALSAPADGILDTHHIRRDAITCGEQKKKMVNCCGVSSSCVVASWSAAGNTGDWDAEGDRSPNDEGWRWWDRRRVCTTGRGRFQGFCNLGRLLHYVCK